MCREEKFMLYIILLFVFVVVYLMMLMRRQKEKMSEIKIQIDQLQIQHDQLQKERDQLQERMNHLEEQREHLQMQIDQAFRSADEIEKICDEIWHHANTIHLYSSLSEEESKSITMKEKQKVIIISVHDRSHRHQLVSKLHPWKPCCNLLRWSVSNKKQLQQTRLFPVDHTRSQYAFYISC